MQKEKGVSTLILIITIIAVAVVAAGGVFAYQYFSTKTQPVVQTQQNQNQQQQAVNQQTNNVQPINQTAQPSITITSPNGGETWTLGTKQTVNYSVSSDMPHAGVCMTAYAVDFSGRKTNLGGIMSVSTPITVDLGTNTTVNSVNLSPGNYKVELDANYCAESNNSFITSDISNNYFSIVAPTTQTAGWKTYTNSDYNFQIEYPNNWFAEKNSLNNVPDLVFCPPNLTYHSNGSTGCMNQPSGYQSGMVYLFAYNTDPKPNNTNYQYLGFNSGKYYYLFNDNGSKDIFSQILSTFKFTK